MAPPSGSSAKFEPVNLNKSYGQPPSSSTAHLSRSRSYGSSHGHGGMVLLARSSRVSSSSSVAAPRVPKLSVPKPVNLPSLRREHAGNDPTVALVGSSGSSGWTRQVTDDNRDLGTRRSGATTAEPMWGMSPQSQRNSTEPEVANQNTGRPNVSNPPSSRSNIPGLPVEKASVFRGEDFPTLQATVVLPPPSSISQNQQKDLQQKLPDRPYSSQDKQKRTPLQPDMTTDSRRSELLRDLHFKSTPSQVERMSQENADRHAHEGTQTSRGPSPLIRLSHTSNWVDDERETLSSFHMEEKVVSAQSERHPFLANWTADYSVDGSSRRPASQSGVNGGVNGGSRFTDSGRMEPDAGEIFERSGGKHGRNDGYKRGWTFSSVESISNRDPRPWNPDTKGWSKDPNARLYAGSGSTSMRNDPSRIESTNRDSRQGNDQRSGKEEYGKQGVNGVYHAQGDRTGRGNGPFRIVPNSLSPGKSGASIMGWHDQVIPGRARDRRSNAFYGQAHNEDPFLGEIMVTGPGSILGQLGRDIKVSKMKKATISDENTRDPARESFEAELERVQKMLEQQRQKAAEEQQKAIELARKEQEERERIAREEEELRFKLEEEARQATIQAQREAEEAARRTEELHRAREEEKRKLKLEEERRKEAARKKLLELEERIARRQEEEILQKRDQTKEATDKQVVNDNHQRHGEVNREHQKNTLTVSDMNQHDEPMLDRKDLNCLPNLSRSPSSSSHGMVQKGRHSPRWRSESLENGQEIRSVQHITGRSYSYSKTDSTQTDYSEHRGSRNSSKNLKAAADSEGRFPSSEVTDADVGNWWRRDDPIRLEPAVSNYLQDTDSTEYPTFGRLRQSLPKQPRVLPPPPGSTALLRKHHLHSDESKSITSVSGIMSSHLILNSTEEVSAEAINDVKDRDSVDMLVSKRIESAPFEEVVLSDAVSQFSDDTVEDERMADTQDYQDQGSHSDVGSETYSEDMNDVSDAMDAHESSEEVDSSILQVSKEQELTDDDSGGDSEGEKQGVNGPKLKLKEEEIINESEIAITEHNITDVEEGFSATDVAFSRTSNEMLDQSVSDVIEEFRDSSSLQQEDTIGSVSVHMQTKIVTEKPAGDHIQQHFTHHVPFLSLSTIDGSQMRNSEGSVSRQSFVQQFQQPFSFMAVPLTQSNNSNNVPVNQAILSSTQNLPSQQEFSLLQLGLFPNVPLMPNAIQIGSIQMPLHIHPQIPQFSQVHSQQKPVLQFGQIGQTGPSCQPSPTLKSVLQVHPRTDQSMLPQHLQLQAEAKAIESLNASSNMEQFQHVQTSEDPSGVERDSFPEPNQTAPSNPYPFSEKDDSLSECVVGDSPKPNGALSEGDVHRDKVVTSNSHTEMKIVSEGQSRVRRRNNVSRYSGILGKGMMRTGQNHGSHVTGDEESGSLNSAKRIGRGRIYHRNYYRTEYKVRTPVPNIDGESIAAEIPKTFFREIRRNQPAVKLERSTFQSSRSGNRGYYKKNEVDTTEDASRIGVVCVFEQPGIETQNDKDDFIKVRSKRQLLREQREQRKKEDRLNCMQPVERKSQQRSNLRVRMHSMTGVSDSNKNYTKKKSEQYPTSQASVISTSVQAIPSTVSVKTKSKLNDSFQKSGSFTKVEQVGSISSGVNMEAGDPGRCLQNACSNEQSIAAWGGQQFSQEVVSFTQIQLEEAMKPFRLEGPLPDQAGTLEKVPVTLDRGTSCMTISMSEKAAVRINAPGPISSLLAGEKIQFGAVTSPSPIPSNSSPSSPLSHAETNVTFELRADTSYLCSRAPHFHESNGVAAFDAKEDNGSVHVCFQRKTIDLEAEAEAAASAVAVAAISNEDMIENHSGSNAPLMGSGSNGEGLSISSSVSIQPQNNGSMENPISVSLPADLLVEVPSTLFQASVNLPASSGVMLPSLPGGTPSFPCLEMGPMLGGPIFTYGPREEASFASMESGLAGWHQSHLSTPDSFYNASPFMNSTGLTNVQGHPPMLVYANPFTSVGQFGQVGVGFMGATYQHSKQPDWTHIPLSSSSGAFGLTDCEMNIVSGSSNDASDPSPPQQTSLPGPSMMPLSMPNFFEASLAPPFQSHWSKAPAPPATSLTISGTAQTSSITRSNPDLPHYSAVIPSQSGYIAHLMDVSSGFNDLPVLRPFAPDVNPQFPDELGLGDTLTLENGFLKDSASGLSDMGNSGSFGAAGKRQQMTRTSQTSDGRKSKGAALNSNSGDDDVTFQNLQAKGIVQIGHSGHHRSPSVAVLDAKASEQKTMTENAKSEWSGSVNHRKGTSGRFPSDRGASGQPSKVKQIYVAKSVSASPKVNAITDSPCRL